MGVVITASESSWTAPFTGLSAQLPQTDDGPPPRGCRHDHANAEKSKNYRYSTNPQVVVDAGTRLAVAVGKPQPGNRNDCEAWTKSGTKDAVGRTTTIGPTSRKAHSLST